MNNINYLISSDNKGLVVQMFEVDMNKGVFLGKVRFGYDILFLIFMWIFDNDFYYVLFFVQGKFVVVFVQSNEGDVFLNIKGFYCMDTGKLCDVFISICNGRVSGWVQENNVY